MAPAPDKCHEVPNNQILLMSTLELGSMAYTAFLVEQKPPKQVMVALYRVAFKRRLIYANCHLIPCGPITFRLVRVAVTVTKAPLDDQVTASSLAVVILQYYYNVSFFDNSISRSTTFEEIKKIGIQFTNNKTISSSLKTTANGTIIGRCFFSNFIKFLNLNKFVAMILLGMHAFYLGYF